MANEWRMALEELLRKADHPRLEFPTRWDEGTYSETIRTSNHRQSKVAAWQR